MRVIPCEYKRAKGNSLTPLFWVKIYLLIDDFGKVSSFLKESDLNTNIELARECGVRVIPKSIECFCSPDFMPNLYQQILDYEKSVFIPDTD